MDPPKRTGKMIMLSLDGALFPWREGNPVLIGMDGTKRLFWPFFDSIARLAQFCAAMQLGFDDVKMVSDGKEFCSQFTAEVQEALIPIYNPTLAGPGNRVTYFEVVLGDGADIPPNPDPLAVQ